MKNNSSITLVYIICMLFVFTSCHQKTTDSENIQQSDSIELMQDSLPREALIDLPIDSLIINNLPVSYPIIYPEKDLHTYDFFFSKLNKCKRGGKSVRITHFGDSQVLYDRGSKELRKWFREEFGGIGIGLIFTSNPHKNGIQNRSINRRTSNNWETYSCFLHPEKDFHSRYGATSVMARFTPIAYDEKTAKTQTASVEFYRSEKDYSASSPYQLLRLHYGFNRSDVSIKIYANQQLISTNTLEANQQYHLFEYRFKDTISQIKIEFEGKDSPEIYGISLQGDKGIIVDNIGLCGSAGVFFSKIDSQIFQPMMKDLSSDMILLQFGGNTIPGMKSDKGVKRYKSLIKKQLQTIKKANPEAAIVMIGPAEMMFLGETDSLWHYHSYMEKVVNCIQEACMEEGAAFFDTYRAMGGKGSIATWVSSRLAMKDHIHLYKSGMRKVLSMFYSALMNDYNQYLEENIAELD